MPIYEFDCHDCGDQFESLVLSISKIDSVSCPQCKGKNVKKRISTFAVKGASSLGSSSFGTSAASCSTGGT